MARRRAVGLPGALSAVGVADDDHVTRVVPHWCRPVPVAVSAGVSADSGVERDSLVRRERRRRREPVAVAVGVRDGPVADSQRTTAGVSDNDELTGEIRPVGTRRVRVNLDDDRVRRPGSSIRRACRPPRGSRLCRCLSRRVLFRRRRCRRVGRCRRTSRRRRLCRRRRWISRCRRRVSRRRRRLSRRACHGRGLWRAPRRARALGRRRRRGGSDGPDRGWRSSAQHRPRDGRRLRCRCRRVGVTGERGRWRFDSTAKADGERHGERGDCHDERGGDE